MFLPSPSFRKQNNIVETYWSFKLISMGKRNWWIFCSTKAMFMECLSSLDMLLKVLQRLLIRKATDLFLINSYGSWRVSLSLNPPFTCRNGRQNCTGTGGDILFPTAFWRPPVALTALVFYIIFLFLAFRINISQKLTLIPVTRLQSCLSVDFV